MWLYMSKWIAPSIVTDYKIVKFQPIGYQNYTKKCITTCFCFFVFTVNGGGEAPLLGYIYCLGATQDCPENYIRKYRRRGTSQTSYAIFKTRHQLTRLQGTFTRPEEATSSTINCFCFEGRRHIVFNFR